MRNFEQNYRILAVLGQGGMAKVMLAIRRGPGGFRKLFVLKQLRPDLAEERYAEMFLDEARLAALLSHPNVVQAHEVGVERDDCFMSMEYLEGQSLARLVRRVTREQLPLELHLFVLSELLAGLHYVHELKDLSGQALNVVHRDVSPGNVFLTYDGQVKLLDFGIATSTISSPQGQGGGLKGKLAYMSPEQAQAGSVDRRADLYSVGIMLWEAIACRPFVPRGQADMITLVERIEGRAPPIEQICPEVEPRLAQACHQALSLAPEERFQSALDFRSLILDYLEGRSIRPNREMLATTMQTLFRQERADLDAKIAAKIASGECSEEPLLTRTMAGHSAMASGQKSSARRKRGSAQERKGHSQALIAGLSVLCAMAGAIAVLWIARGQGLAPASAPAPLALAPGQRPLATSMQHNDEQPPSTRRSAARAPKRASIAPSITRQSPPPQKEQARPAVELSVKVSPADASIELDGVELGTGAVRIKRPRSRDSKRLVVKRSGFQSASRQVQLLQDQEIELELEADALGIERRHKNSGGRKKKRHRRNSARRARSENSPREEVELPRITEPQDQLSTSRAGDDLRPLKNTNTRVIDKENPYQ